ncbi:hypothetical protein HK098_001689 [Nowakowskiella sp. JEL0407]|nr:hypothetical protein HK098_001689 [Nowakowskiella sp. JEL0407]
MMPKSFEDIFSELGEDFHEHVKLVRVAPFNYTVNFMGDGNLGDGGKRDRGDQSSCSTPNEIHLSSDLALMRRELEKFKNTDPNAFQSFLSFLEESRQHYDLSVQHVLHENFTSFTSILKSNLVPLVFKLHVFGNCFASVKKFFKNEKLRRAFTFQSMYLGMNPFEAPATYNLLQFTEFAEGIWYPIGGFHAVVAALEKLAIKRGAKFQYSSPVTQINISPTTNKATGVTIIDPKTKQPKLIPADIVICNADLIYAYNSIIPPEINVPFWHHYIPRFIPESTSYIRHLSRLDHTCSTFSFYWGLSKKLPGLDPHNIFLADEYKASFDSIFKELKLPDTPSFYVHVPTKMDTSLAPDGKEIVIVLVPTGHMTESEEASNKDGSGITKRNEKFAGMKHRARAFVIKVLSEKVGEDIEALIEVEEQNTPETWKEKFNLFKGSALGLSHPIFQVLWFRPRTRHARIGNLFFVGASTHPGTGVPIVLYCARLVAKQILELSRVGFKYQAQFSVWGLVVALILLIVVLIVAIAGYGI